MFKMFKKKPDTEVLAVVSGTAKDLKKVDDQAFSKGSVGKGIAIVPDSRKIVSPIDGTVQMIFPTKHALGIKTDDGVEILLHIGIDTVELKGEGFKLLVNESQVVKAGQPLLDIDFDVFTKRGYKTDCIVVVTEPKDGNLEFEVKDGVTVMATQPLFKILK